MLATIGLENYARPIAIVLVLLFWAGSGNPGAARAEVPYTVEFQGVADPELQATLAAVSSLEASRDRPPASVGMLNRRAKRDLPNLQKALRALGYYDAQIRYAIDRDQQPVQVVVTIDRGPPYLIRVIDIQLQGADETLRDRLPSPESVGLRLDSPLHSRTVVDAQKKLLQALQHDGYPFAKVADRKIIVDHKRKSAEITFVLDPGRLATFGETTFTGLESVQSDFLQARLPWQVGQRYDADLITEARKRLADTNLFAAIQITAAPRLTDSGQLPMTIDLRERKHRSVRGGVRYTTDVGIGARLSWEHRNLFHRGERLLIEGNASSLARELDGSLKKPNFYGERQSLLLNFRLADETTDAYDSTNIETQAMVEHYFRDQMSLSLGLGFRYSKVDQQDIDEFAFFYVPAHFNWDTTVDRFDPTAGGRLKIEAAPYVNTLGEKISFLKSYIDYSHYFRLFQKPDLIFAGRAALGSIAGSGWQSVPADLRFYAGGGGSIRGYAYQSVGPLDASDDPIGGNSILLLNTELRAKVTQTVGFAVFLDGGSAFSDTYPSFDHSLRWGAGAGFRYYTPVGPLRLDLAFPLNRRADIDDSFQLYISLGQAF